MKTKTMLFLILLISTILNNDNVHAQGLYPPYPLTEYASPTTFKQSTLFESYRNYFGLGINAPKAKLHIYSPYSSYALLKIETQPTLDQLSSDSILFMGIKNSARYGIYQPGSNSLTFRNYFHNKVCIGNDDGYDILNVTGHITLAPPENEDTIKIHVNSNGSIPTIAFKFRDLQTTSTPLSINAACVKTPCFETDFIKINNHAGINKVLMSDDFGNGQWTDASRFITDYWLVNQTRDLYLNTDRYPHLGIGVQVPIDRFQVNSGTAAVSIGSVNDQSMDWGNGYIGFNEARRDNYWYNYSDANSSNGGAVIYNDDMGNLFFSTIPTGTSSINPLSDQDIKDHRKVIISKDGSVGVGTLNTHGYKLAVNGKVICEELKVQLFNEWPDYVFNQKYKLLPLNELEQFIEKNKHLPDVPTEETIKKDGINMGEMNTILLKKIEELTKYVIEQQKQIDELRANQKQIPM
ncbi:MAG: hypothetical protein NTU51_01570 [Bacteroidetes bacterium]|nr:hypothetical protein [Bacteroidota bacterium]